MRKNRAFSLFLGRTRALFSVLALSFVWMVGLGGHSSELFDVEIAAATSSLVMKAELVAPEVVTDSLATEFLNKSGQTVTGSQGSAQVSQSKQDFYSTVSNNSTVSAATGSSNPNTVASATYLRIGEASWRLFDVNDTTIDAGYAVARYRSTTPAVDGKFLYSHNTSQVFAGLANLPAGTIVTASVDGTAKYYRVVRTETMTKELAARAMHNLVRARWLGVSYDLAIMTCAGTSLAGGDATHRTVVFAVAV